jgi:hypothetical protein
MGRSLSGATRVALALLATAGLAVAQAPTTETSPVKVSVGGIAGPLVRARPRSFVAVRVLLENGSAKDVEGLIRVYRSAGPSDPTAQQSLFFEKRVSLPRAGRRAETVYYYCQENEPEGQLCVAFQPDEGVAPEAVFPRLELVDGTLVTLVVSSLEAEEALQLFRGARVPGPRKLWKGDAARADVSALPDHFAGYDAFDAVFVTDLDPADLPPDRARALIEWVEAGGDLIVAFSPRGGVPPDLIPLLPIGREGGGMKTVERTLQPLRALAHGPLAWPADDKVLCDDVRAGPGAEVLAGRDHEPLILRGRRGAGWVTYLAFPCDAAPLRRWGDRPMFVGSLLRLPRDELGEKLEVGLVAPPLEELQLNLSEALASLTPPSAIVIAPLLLLYVALVSPLNYAVLSRRRRLGLSQPIAAVVVLVFGAIFYMLGRVYKGSEDLVTQVAVIEVPATPRAKARVDVMTGYYSTGQALVSADAPRGALVGPIAEEASGREGRVVAGADAQRLEELTVATWSLRRFRSLRAEDQGSIELDLSLEESIVRGKIVNHTPHKLETAALLLPTGYIELPEVVKPGETIELRGNGVQRYDAGRVERMGLLQALLRSDATSGYKVQYGRDAASVSAMRGGDSYGGSTARRVLAILQNRLRRIPASHTRLPALLVARSIGDAGGVVVEGTGAPNLARRVMLTEGQVRLPTEGRITLSNLEARVVHLPSNEQDWTPVDGGTGAPALLHGGMDPNEVQFVWTVPSTEEAPLRLDMLRVRWQLDGTLPVEYAKQSDLWILDVKKRGYVRAVALAEGKRDPADGSRYFMVPDVDIPQSVDVNDFLDPASGTIKFKISTTLELRIASVTLDISGTR